MIRMLQWLLIVQYRIVYSIDLPRRVAGRRIQGVVPVVRFRNLQFDFIESMYVHRSYGIRSFRLDNNE
jgi:hypothetical protein